MSTKKRKQSKSRPAPFPYRWTSKPTPKDSPGIVYRAVEVVRCTVTVQKNTPPGDKGTRRGAELNEETNSMIIQRSQTEAL